MAPIILPPAQSEKFTISGTGLHALTQQQRNSRQLSLQIEKIKNSNRNFYFNFRTPEPSSFWGYIQTVSFDTIIDTFELKFRRQSIIRWDAYELEPIEQLRCLIKESTLLIFDTATNFYIANGADPVLLGQDRANYLLNTGQPRLIPTIPITGIYYEIDGNFLGQVTAIWQDYASPCGNPAGNQILPPPRGPGAGESGSNSSGGGGTRPGLPPPPIRTADPDSDSPAPPPDSPTGPDSPTLAAPPLPPGKYAVTILWEAGQTGSGPIICGPSLPQTTNLTVINGPAQIVTVPVSGINRTVIQDKDGNFIQTLFFQAINTPCPSQVNSVNQTLIP
jgi:hypothetical protein